MSDIKNLTKKIIENANAVAEDIIEKAREKENNMISKKVAIADKEKNTILAKAKSEALTKKHQIISNANLQVRDMRLSAKRQVLDKIFSDCVENLNKMNETDMKSFIKNSILSSDIDGDEKIIIDEDSFKNMDNFIDELNENLSKKGKVGKLTLDIKKDEIGKGYILSKNGVQINNTFKFLIESLRNDIEYEVAKILFS